MPSNDSCFSKFYGNSGQPINTTCCWDKVMHNVNQRLRDQASYFKRCCAPCEVVLSAFHTGSKKKKKIEDIDRFGQGFGKYSLYTYIYIYMRDIFFLLKNNYLVFFFVYLSSLFDTTHTCL